MSESAPEAHALVVLPFASAEKAQQFAQLVIAQMPGTAAPFVMHGTAYHYESAEEGSAQVIEIWPESNFESFVGERGDNHIVLQRPLREEDDASSTD